MRPPTRRSGYRGKRAFDLAVAGLALVLAAPLMACIALLVRWRLGRPVLFRQQRPGLHGAPFTINKFRTMRDARDEHGAPLPDSMRLTPLGRLLRSTSLDELPELVNVLRGEMSIVGPRPLLLSYLERYKPVQARRHEVRPGITGLAQVSGRNALAWDDRLALDVWYVDHQSLALDLRILARTLGQVLRREGISAPGEATVSEFMGSTHAKGDA
jgi:lipopolysaccharide/colanic/teichoic acid biosynthesis glycosyltransferase